MVNALQEGKSTVNKDAKDNDADEEEWSVDTSEDAVKARMEKMSNGVATLTIHSDLEKTSAERVDLFYKFSKVSGMTSKSMITHSMLGYH